MASTDRNLNVAFEPIKNQSIARRSEPVAKRFALAVGFNR